VTHRGLSKGVTFVTGHTAFEASDTVGLNWKALADGGTTLVIYMGLSNLGAIVSALLKAGMKASMPIAVVQEGTLPTQRSVVGRLDQIAGAVARAALASPALVVVGEVVRFAHSIALQDTERKSA
jgi:uroporphyrin-III C-methyltransferase